MPKDLKALANRAARVLADVEGADLIDVLRQFASAEGLRQDHTPPLTSSPRRVGIWQKSSDDASEPLVRSLESMDDWHLWANVGRIAPKGRMKRVLLIGESAARGWFYEPSYTPAQVLQAVLNRALGDGVCEVVDLARTNLGYEIADLARDASVLEPDAVVIFAGNNWSGSRGDSAVGAGLSAAQLSAGAARAAAETQARVAARKVVASVMDHYTAVRVPVIWVVPESNLADWQDPLTEPPHLEMDQLQRWHTAIDRLRVLGSDYLRTKQELAERALEIDGGCCGFVLKALAECKSAAGKIEAARHFLENARDAPIWDFSQPIAPRPYGVTQNVLRSAADLGAWVVDLPGLFARWFPGEPPGRRLFLDYCHLSEEGIRLAMAAIAETLCALLGTAAPKTEELFKYAPRPTSRVAATAHFLAGIHNAHWWQPAEIVDYHCLRAADSSSHVSELMSQFLDVQTSGTPVLMSRLADHLSDDRGAPAQHYMLRYNEQRLDRVLLESITKSLTVGSSGSQSERLRTRWKSAHSVARKRVDLLSFFYLAEAGQPKELLWAMPAARQAHYHIVGFYRAYSRCSAFVFVGEASIGAVLSLTARCPAVDVPMPLIVLLDGAEVSRLAIDSQWRSFHIDLPESRIRDGILRLELHWPFPTSPLSMPRRCGESSAGRVYGEIHSFFCRRSGVHLGETVTAHSIPGRPLHGSGTHGSAG